MRKKENLPKRDRQIRRKGTCVCRRASVEWREKERMCVLLRAAFCMCVYVCVSERERERERGCLGCACVREREKQSVTVCI